MKIKHYKIQHSIDEYTFPKKISIHTVTFNEKYMHVELTDERIISIPLKWIPTLSNASKADREKFKLSRSRSMIVWDPDKSGINDEIRIVDYLGPTGVRKENHSGSPSRRKQTVETKPQRRKKN